MRSLFGRSLGVLALSSAVALVGLSFTAGPADATAAASSRVVIQHGYSGPAHAVGRYGAGRLSLTVTLKSQHAAALEAELSALYDPSSSRYHDWLSSRRFDALFGPSATQRAAVSDYLRRSGLTVTPGSSPFLLVATGDAAEFDLALHTTITQYRSGRSTFHANSTAASLPRRLAGSVQGVIGLADVKPSHTQYVISHGHSATGHSASRPSYGAGPDHSGLTPSQTIGLNSGTKLRRLGAKGQGGGTTLAVFELSGYTEADISAWWKHFYGNHPMPALVNIESDGGPVAPNCPAGDQCGPFEVDGTTVTGLHSADYSGDVEVEADIELLLAMDPAAARIDVYDAPNDLTDQTTVDQYERIAEQDTASVVSVSWAECEADITGDTSTPNRTIVDAEETAFEKMAAQGQSVFAASGDTGAYGCLRTSGNSVASVLDPASDPYVTGVGGTSYESYDPQGNPAPTYPTGFQTVWNPLDLCAPGQNDVDGFCSEFGAGGGGNSTLWAAPSWEKQVRGVVDAESSFTCGATGTSLCREVPDVSADADEFDPYAEFCTGKGTTGAAAGNPDGYPGDSNCFTDGIELGFPAWFGIGGTSVSTPLWAGVFGQVVGLHGHRQGLGGADLFYLYSHAGHPWQYFYDVTGRDQVENNNGLYPTTPGYDQATGLGTPDIDAIAGALP